LAAQEASDIAVINADDSEVISTVGRWAGTRWMFSLREQVAKEPISKAILFWQFERGKILSRSCGATTSLSLACTTLPTFLRRPRWRWPLVSGPEVIRRAVQKFPVSRIDGNGFDH
jgi:hypothetical protein